MQKRFNEKIENFVYRAPEDPEQLLYDFYFMVGHMPNEHSDRVLNFVFKEALEDCTSALQKHMLAAVYWSLSAEFRHVFRKGRVENQDPSSSLKKLLLDYRKKTLAYGDDDSKGLGEEDRITAAASANRTLQQPVLAGAGAKMSGREASFKESFLALEYARKKQNLSKLETAMLLVEAFEFSGWKGTSYGGKAWANIAQAYVDLAKARTVQDRTVYIDHAYDLQHNTGSVFTKVQSYYKQGSQNWLGKALNWKRDVKDLRAFYDKVSYSLKEVVAWVAKEKGMSIESFGKASTDIARPSSLKPAWVVFSTDEERDMLDILKDKGFTFLDPKVLPSKVGWNFPYVIIKVGDRDGHYLNVMDFDEAKGKYKLFTLEDLVAEEGSSSTSPLEEEGYAVYMEKNPEAKEILDLLAAKGFKRKPDVSWKRDTTWVTADDGSISPAQYNPEFPFWVVLNMEEKLFDFKDNAPDGVKAIYGVNDLAMTINPGAEFEVEDQKHYAFMATTAAQNKSVRIKLHDAGYIDQDDDGSVDQTGYFLVDQKAKTYYLSRELPMNWTAVPLNYIDRYIQRLQSAMPASKPFEKLLPLAFFVNSLKVMTSLLQVMEEAGDIQWSSGDAPLDYYPRSMESYPAKIILKRNDEGRLKLLVSPSNSAVPGAYGANKILKMAEDIDASILKNVKNILLGSSAEKSTPVVNLFKVLGYDDAKFVLTNIQKIKPTAVWYGTGEDILSMPDALSGGGYPRFIALDTATDEAYLWSLDAGKRVLKEHPGRYKEINWLANGFKELKLHESIKWMRSRKRFEHQGLLLILYR